MIRRAFQLASTLVRAAWLRVAMWRRYGLRVHLRAMGAGSRIGRNLGSKAGRELIDYAKLLMRRYPMIGPIGYADLLGLLAELTDPKRAMTLNDAKWAAFCFAVRRNDRNLRRLVNAHRTAGPISTAQAMDVVEGGDDA